MHIRFATKGRPIADVLREHLGAGWEQMTIADARAMLLLLCMWSVFADYAQERAKDAGAIVAQGWPS